MGEEISEVTVHVIENGSQVAGQLTAKYQSALQLNYHQFPQGNKSLALNQVAKDLPDDTFLIFLDDDVAARPGTLTAFRQAAEKFGPGHYFGGVLHPDFDRPPSPKVLPYLPPEARTIDHSRGKKYHTYQSFQFFMGACWACYAADLARAGYFNPDYGPGASSGARGQETDTQLRLYERGVKPVALRDAVVDHYVPERAVTADFIVDRIYKAMVQPGARQSSLLKSLGLGAKLLYSVLLLPLAPDSVGHRYRIAKAAGYFRGLSNRAAGEPAEGAG